MLDFISLDAILEVTLDNASAQGGAIRLRMSNYGNTEFVANRLDAPQTRVELARGSTPSYGEISLENSSIAGLAVTTPSEGVAEVTLRNVVVGSDGFLADARAASGGMKLAILNTEIRGVGLRVSGFPDWAGIGLGLDASVSGSGFPQGGVEFTTSTQLLYPELSPLAADYSLVVEGSRFAAGGVAVTHRGGIDDQGARVTLRLANNSFSSSGSGIDADFDLTPFPGAPGNPTVSRLEIVNNTFSGNDTGIKLTTSPHTPGLRALTTLIKNNIIAGGRTGIEVRGLDDHTITIENNDVLGRPDRRYLGDIADQTGRNGNISLPPWFAGPNDLRLQKISPCIDRGGIGPEVPATDINGLARPQDGNGDSVVAPDMGAHERPGPVDRRATIPKAQ
jgi:hypothetical protein